MFRYSGNPLIGKFKWGVLCLLMALFIPAAVCGATKAPTGSAPGETVVASAAVNAAVKAYIIRHAPWKPDQLKITRMTFDQELMVPAGKIEFRVKAPKHTDWLGPVPFRVHILVDGRDTVKVQAPATLEVWSDVVLTVKPLGKYQPIEADDIVVKKMNLARVPANAVVRADRVLGLRARHNIAANCVLRSNQIESPPVVMRGDVVQMIAESALLKVAAKGMAKENGAAGDRIRVMNLRSKRIIHALVLDDQTVRVEF
jgi:flagellar basal body P-ring formation protein FlgA